MRFLNLSATPLVSPGAVATGRWEFTSRRSEGTGLFDSNARDTCLANLMGHSAVKQGMNDFIFRV